MINSLSNQNYYYQYPAGQIAQLLNNIESPPQTGKYLPPTSATEAKRNQELGQKECKTWSARKYKDQSGDPSVSMQSPTHLSPDEAPGAVIAHEREHVQHNAEKAAREGEKATSFVQIHTSICPECGRIFVSGGTTTTYYFKKEPLPEDESKGSFVNVRT